MTRVKRSIHAKKKRRAVLERAKGFRGGANSHYKQAKEAVIKAETYAYRDRRNRKRDFRRLWVTRINAAARQNGMNYNQFIHGIQLAGIELDARSSRTSPSAIPRRSPASPRPPRTPPRRPRPD